MMLRTIAARLGPVALAAGMAVGCAHASKGGYSRFVQGNVPDYDGVWKDLNRPPDESLHHFVARVRRLAATATKPASTLAPSLEASDPVLRDRLATLALAPTSSNHWQVGEAYRHAGVLDRAQDHFQESVRLDPRFAAGWDGLARTWRDWGAPEYALADASRAVYFAPGEPA